MSRDWHSVDITAGPYSWHITPQTQATADSPDGGQVLARMSVRSNYQEGHPVHGNPDPWEASFGLVVDSLDDVALLNIGAEATIYVLRRPELSIMPGWSQRVSRPPLVSFIGRVSDLDAEAHRVRLRDGTFRDRMLVTVTLTDRLVDVATIDVGASAWPAEHIADRLSRLINETGILLASAYVYGQVAAREAGAESALQLFHQTANDTYELGSLSTVSFLALNAASDTYIEPDGVTVNHAPNPRALGAGGWLAWDATWTATRPAAGGVSVTRSAGAAAEPSCLARVSYVGGSDTDTRRQPVVAGQAVRASVNVAAPAGTVARVACLFYDAAGQLIGAPTWSAPAAPGRVQLYVPAAPAGAATLMLGADVVTPDNSPAPTGAAVFDECLLQLGAEASRGLSPYFDGNTPPPADYSVECRWLGPEHASASRREDFDYGHQSYPPRLAGHNARYAFLAGDYKLGFAFKRGPRGNASNPIDLPGVLAPGDNGWTVQIDALPNHPVLPGSMVEFGVKWRKSRASRIDRIVVNTADGATSSAKRPGAIPVSWTYDTQLTGADQAFIKAQDLLPEQAENGWSFDELTIVDLPDTFAANWLVHYFQGDGYRRPLVVDGVSPAQIPGGGTYIAGVPENVALTFDGGAWTLQLTMRSDIPKPEIFTPEMHAQYGAPYLCAANMKTDPQLAVIRSVDIDPDLNSIDLRIARRPD